MCEHRTEIEKRFNRIGLIDNYTYIYISHVVTEDTLFSEVAHQIYEGNNIWQEENESNQHPKRLLSWLIILINLLLST